MTDVALVLLELYVHLPLKHPMHAVDPIQKLNILRMRLGGQSSRSRLDGKSARAFHDEMIGIFHSLRDLHTSYELPAAYQKKLAFLPFLIEMYYEADNPAQPRFVVSRTLAGFSHPDFKIGVNVTYWNGVPINRAVALNADREAGSNDNARIVRGLEAMTIRPMSLTAPPDEEWVIVGYETGGRALEMRFEWHVFTPPPPPAGTEPTHLGASEAVLLGVDERTEFVRRAESAVLPFEDGGGATDGGPCGGGGRGAQAAVVRDSSAPATHAAPPGEGPDGDGGRSSPPASSTIGYDIQTSRRSDQEVLVFPPEDGVGTANGRTYRGPRRRTCCPVPPHLSLMPDVFEFRRVKTEDREVGYLRIYTFMVGDPTRSSPSSSGSSANNCPGPA